MLRTQSKEKVEPSESHTDAFPGIFGQMIPNAHVTNNTRHQKLLCTYIFQAACGKEGTSDGRAGLYRSTHPTPSSKHHKYNIHGYKTVAKFKEEGHTTRLSLSFFHPVSFSYEMIKNHTPKILATTSTSSGMARLLLIEAFFSAGREAIQSQFSALLSLFTINSVME